MNLIAGLIDTDVVLPILIFAVPIVAIVGGITAGIVKTITDAKMMENAQRERLAAIQHGVDPDKLPPLPTLATSSDVIAGFNPRAAQLHRAQGLLIGGIVTLFAGVGIAIFLSFIADGRDAGRIWAVGIIPAFIGVALLLSAAIVWPRGNGGSRA